jgi:hypothetical protein
LWINYLREKISRPGEMSTGLKRRAAGWVSSQRWLTENPAMRAAWDVGIGSNFFIARRLP